MKRSRNDGKGERVQHETSRPFPSTFLRSLLIPFLSLVVPPHSIHSNRRVRRSRGWRGGTGDTSNRRLLHSLRTVRSRRMRWQNGSEWVKREPRDPTHLSSAIRAEWKEARREGTTGFLSLLSFLLEILSLVPSPAPTNEFLRDLCKEIHSMTWDF